jgi:hypothetical protein
MVSGCKDGIFYGDADPQTGTGKENTIFHSFIKKMAKEP